MCARNEIRRQALAAVFIQTAWRRFIAERRYKQLRRIALIIQSNFRGKQAREKLRVLRANETPIAILNNNDVNKKKLAFDINKVRTISLNQFNVRVRFSISKFPSAERP